MSKKDYIKSDVEYFKASVFISLLITVLIVFIAFIIYHAEYNQIPEGYQSFEDCVNECENEAQRVLEVAGEFNVDITHNCKCKGKNEYYNITVITRDGIGKLNIEKEEKQ